MDPAELAALLEGLEPVRWPALGLAARAGDLLAAAALGLAIAAALAPILRRMGRVRRPAAPAPAAATDLLARLKHADPAAFERLRPQLYRPGGLPDPAELEAMLARAPR